MSKIELEDNQIIEHKIVEYLQQVPDFFDRHPKLLDSLKLNHKVYGSVSLVERQILNLREKNVQLQSQLNDLLDNAETNSKLLQKCADLFVVLINARSEQEFVDSLLQRLHHNFELDNCQLWLCNDSGTLSHVNYTDHQTLQQLTDQSFIKDEPVCGRVTESISQLLGGDESLNSYAMIPLDTGAKMGLLILGSKDVELFTADMGTLFLRLIGDATEACLNAYHDAR